MPADLDVAELLDLLSARLPGFTEAARPDRPADGLAYLLAAGVFAVGPDDVPRLRSVCMAALRRHRAGRGETYRDTSDRLRLDVAVDAADLLHRLAAAGRLRLDATDADLAAVAVRLRELVADVSL